MKCPNCRNQIIQKTDEGFKLHVKGRIIWKGSICESKCYWCGEPVKVLLPVDLDKAIRGNQRYVIKQ
jgi:hypothetical protein